MIQCYRSAADHDSYKRLRIDCDALGRRHRRIHDLRRTGITLYREAGADRGRSGRRQPSGNSPRQPARTGRRAPGQVHQQEWRDRRSPPEGAATIRRCAEGVTASRALPAARQLPSRRCRFASRRLRAAGRRCRPARRMRAEACCRKGTAKSRQCERPRFASARSAHQTDRIAEEMASRAAPRAASPSLSGPLGCRGSPYYIAYYRRVASPSENVSGGGGNRTRAITRDPTYQRRPVPESATHSTM